MFIRHCVCCSRRLAHGRGEYTSIEWDTLAVFGPDFEGSFSRSIWGPDAPTVRTGSSYCAPRGLSKQEKRGFASILLRDVSETFRLLEFVLPIYLGAQTDQTLLEVVGMRSGFGWKPLLDPGGGASHQALHVRITEGLQVDHRIRRDVAAIADGQDRRVLVGR